MRIRTKTIAAAAVVALAGAGVAYATIPTDGVISACYAKSGGTLHVIDATTGACTPKETSLAWNVAGAKGEPGATGATGATGPTGPAGPAGPAGVSGYEMVEERKETALPFHANVSALCPSGKVALGGGGLVQLYSPDSFISLGSPVSFSYPGGSPANFWNLRIDQPAVAGATQAVITARVICAAVGT